MYNQPQTEGDKIGMPTFQIDFKELDKLAQINLTIEIEMTSNYC